MQDETTPAILDVLSEAVFVVDGRRRVLVANARAKNLFGRDIEGHDFVRAVRHPDCVACVDAVLDGQGASQTVITLQTPVPVVFRVRVAALDSDEVSTARAVISFDDISDIQEAEKMRSDFVANVSHELRSPLTALRGFIETLKGPAKDDPEAQQHFLNVMEGEALRMKRLIDDLLSLSKVEINARNRPTTKLDVHSIIQRVIATLSMQTSDAGSTVKLDIPDEFPPIPGDADELTQVFQNLIENALKYAKPATEVLITIRNVDNEAGVPGSALRIDVHDEGPGIPAHHIPRLTERFYRVDDGRSREKGGTGLGLAIVKHIVGRHRGRLRISSQENVGSTFSVILPVDGA